MQTVAELSEAAVTSAHTAIVASEITAASSPVPELAAATLAHASTVAVTVIAQQVAELTGDDPLSIALQAAEEAQRRRRAGRPLFEGVTGVT